MEQAYRNKVIQGNCYEVLQGFPDKVFDTCITSPPYFGLRDYGVDPVYWPAFTHSFFGAEVSVPEWTGAYGLEPTPEMYVAHTVMIFREVRRVLKDDGTLWLNLGDSYATGGRGYSNSTSSYKTDMGWKSAPKGLKHKDLVGIPWRVAFALQADGWYLRQDIIWHKPNPMPESVTDRCTKAHEYIFLLSKKPKYYYDHKSIMVPVTESSVARLSQNIDEQAGGDRVPGKANGPMKAVLNKKSSWNGSSFDTGKTGEMKHTHGGTRKSGNKERKDASERSVPDGTGSNVCASVPWEGAFANKRSVWTVTTKPFNDAHFAVYPENLIVDCIKAGCPKDGIVLDPFGGSGTTGIVARSLDRNYLLIEQAAHHIEVIHRRGKKEFGMFYEQ